MRKKKMTQTNGNGKATLARLEQRLSDYICHTDEKIDLIRESYETMNTKLDNITNILVSGEGKIRENRQLINEHCREHVRQEWKSFKMYGLVISACALIATVVSLLIRFA